MVHLFVLLFGFVLPSSGQDVPCTVRQGDGWTRYSVPEFSASGCHYSWANGSSHVMANHEEHLKHLVLDRSINTLTINTCLEQVIYHRDCISEGVSYQANCTATCTGIPAPIQIKKGIHYHFCVAAIVGFVLSLLGISLCALRYRRHCCLNTEADVEAQCG